MRSVRSSCAPALRRVMGAALCMAATRGLASIPSVERLTTPLSPHASEAYMESQNHDEADASRAEKKPFSFAVKDTERGLFDHGVTPDAKTFIAEAEEQYRASSAMLHQAPSMALPETETRVDPLTGRTVRVTRIAAPVGDVYVPSNKERFALRGHVGELERQRLEPQHALPDDHAQLALKKERQLEELLSSPMGLLPKAQEVQWLLGDCYAQKLPLSPRTVEAVMQVFSHASLHMRVTGQRPGALPVLGESDSGKSAKDAEKARLPAHGKSLSGPPSSMDDVPFLGEMRQLYTHQKTMFTAPTALTLELLMTTVSAVTVANKHAFHFANRLLLDSDKYVVLPTRTMFTAFFMVCQANDAMPIAIARFTDAVTSLHIPPNAPMVTALLTGLNESGYVEEALALLSRTQHVPLSTPLLNASLEALLLSKQPLACFSAMASVKAASLELSAETYTLLLLACEQSGDWSRVTAILADMQARRVKGNAQTLNLLLKGLLKEKLNSYARQLHRTMLDKKIEVWPALEDGLKQINRALPPQTRRKG